MWHKLLWKWKAIWDDNRFQYRLPCLCLLFDTSKCSRLILCLYTQFPLNFMIFLKFLKCELQALSLVCNFLVFVNFWSKFCTDRDRGMSGCCNLFCQLKCWFAYLLLVMYNCNRGPQTTSSGTSVRALSAWCKFGIVYFIRHIHRAYLFTELFFFQCE